MKCLNDIPNGQASAEIVSLLVNPSRLHVNDKYSFCDQQILQFSTKLPHEMENFTNAESVQPFPILSFNYSQ